MNSGHSHTHTVAAEHRGRLTLVLSLVVALLVAEVVGGLLTGSLALLADAGHLATDAVGLSMALTAIMVARRPPTHRRTFGWQRLEIVAAVGNGLLLFTVAVWVLVEAGRRLAAPPAVHSAPMLIIACAGLAVNVGSLLLLRAGQAESLTIRGAYVEVLGDLFGSVAVIVAAVVIATSGWQRADPIASAVIGLAILPRAWALTRDALDILLEATPRGVDLEEVRAHIAAVAGVRDVHDLHAWTITSGVPVLSAHVVVEDDRNRGEVLDRLGECLGDHFAVEHCTFQIEPAGHRDHERVLHD